jgi:hypothetical protein
MNTIQVVASRSEIRLILRRRTFCAGVLAVAAASVLLPSAAFAQKGTGQPCTNELYGMPWGCEQFGWMAPAPGGFNPPVRMWDVSQGYCVLNEVLVGNAGVGTVSFASVSVTNGTWFVSGSGGRGPAFPDGAIAKCFQFPSVQAPVLAQQNGGNNTPGLLGTNASFCGIAGLGYEPSLGTHPLFTSAVYPSTATKANLYEVVQNDNGPSANNDIIAGECLVAPNNLWWGTSGHSSAPMGQTVFQYSGTAILNATQTAPYITDLPSTNFICGFQMLAAVNRGDPIDVSIDVDPNSGNWGVFGNAEFIINCIDPTGAFINSGGVVEGPYYADEDYAGGSTIRHTNTIDVSGVTNPAPQAVYQDARIGDFTYTLPGFQPGSSHRLRLHFAETYFSSKGSRVFNVSINGQQVLTSFDIFAAAGAKNKAIVKTFTEAADSTGQFTVQFSSLVNNSLVSAVEVE